MGVCGCGKSSLGRLLATHLACEFVEGDDLHPAANVAKMRAGIALEDADRWGWLGSLVARLRTQPPVIASCSALRKSYRDFLRGKIEADLIFLCLTGERELLLQRLGNRTGHYMPASLLDSQLATFESPQGEENVFMLSIEDSLSELVHKSLNFINTYGKKVNVTS